MNFNNKNGDNEVSGSSGGTLEAKRGNYSQLNAVMMMLVKLN